MTASAYSIFLANEQVGAAKNGEVIPRIMGCGHRHKFGHWFDGDGLIFVTPGWQFLTRHGLKAVPAARLKVGIGVLDWRKKPDGALPHFESITCSPPQEEGVTL